ncbi:MAG TPA: hypothetical protein VKD72_23790 [Gemmataceae bacterium]|nr:hypothetical protein [Gemmataceae bacterium]
MERQLYRAIVAVLANLARPRTPTRFDFRDEDIVTVYYWSVLCDRPTSWACREEHCPSTCGSDRCPRRRRRPGGWARPW